MSTGFYIWSQTAASNATADSAINWAEGQAPSSVNDSARAVMAGLAKWRDDISGSLTTAGTSTAYTLTTNEVFDSLAHMSGMMIAVVFHTACGASPTLAVDGLTAKNINKANGTNIASGDLIASVPYVLTYNNSDGVFYVQGSVTGIEIPSGTLMLFQQTSAPTGWTKQTTHNDKALRVVSGTASSGGSVAFSTVFARTGTDAVTLAQNNLPNVQLTVAAPTISASFGLTTTGTHTSVFQCASPSSGTDTAMATASTSTTGYLSGGASSQVSFTPAMDIRVNYVDLIIASKN